MDSSSRHADRGFQFPGDFELSAMGRADAGLLERVPQVLGGLGLGVDPDSLSERPSRGGRYVSVRLRLHARNREELDAAHRALRALPGVRWTL